MLFASSDVFSMLLGTRSFTLLTYLMGTQFLSTLSCSAECKLLPLLSIIRRKMSDAEQGTCSQNRKWILNSEATNSAAKIKFYSRLVGCYLHISRRAWHTRSTWKGILVGGAEAGNFSEKASGLETSDHFSGFFSKEEAKNVFHNVLAKLGEVWLQLLGRMARYLYWKRWVSEGAAILVERSSEHCPKSRSVECLNSFRCCIFRFEAL